MGSTRAPGKVMRDLDGMPVFMWTISALENATGIDEIILATSTLPADDVIADHCRNVGVKCFRGNEADVLDRFYQCAVQEGADVIIRVTCDCPFLDSAIISQVIKLRDMTDADYCSNIEPPTFPDGLDVECFTFRALESAHKEATRATDRDCLTQFIVRNRHRFAAINVTCPLPGLRKERWVLDTEEDWKFCKELAARTGPCSNYVEILNVLDKEPHLREINNAQLGTGRNERFYDGVTSERLSPRKFDNSTRLFNRAIEHIPYGAQTFSKSYLQFPAGEAPLFASHADGARIFDVDGNDYIDLVSALLPVVLGYRDPDVDYAIRRQLDCGISLSLATELEAKLSELLCRIIPCAEMVKLGKTGTDVTTAAIRLARACTGRDHVYLSGYHGWADWSMSVTERSFGVPERLKSLSHRFTYGDQASLDIGHVRDNAAAIIVEPNDNPEFLRWLRKFCTQHGIVLIFDEIITGFRYELGGAQQLYGVTPDLATFGKAMGNGMPISALVGKRKFMQRMAPPDNIFYSGTFFGETLSIAAAIATIEKIERENVIGHLVSTGVRLEAKILDAIYANDLEGIVKVDGWYSRLMMSFKDDKIKTLFMREMIQNGVLIINSNNLSYAHKKPELRRICSAYEATLEKIGAVVRHGSIDKVIREAVSIPGLRAVT